jgi:hypothetical protein
MGSVLYWRQKEFCEARYMAADVGVREKLVSKYLLDGAATRRTATRRPRSD